MRICLACNENMGTRQAASFKVVLFPQSFKFGDISEINENISFLSSLVNARKITVFQRYACGEHARTRVRGHREQRATQSYI